MVAHKFYFVRMDLDRLGSSPNGQTAYFAAVEADLSDGQSISYHGPIFSALQNQVQCVFLKYGGETKRLCVTEGSSIVYVLNRRQEREHSDFGDEILTDFFRIRKDAKTLLDVEVSDEIVTGERAIKRFGEIQVLERIMGLQQEK